MTTESSTSTSSFTWNKIDWSSMTGVVQARDGMRGAWFLHDQYGHTIVVKSQADAEAQVMGTVFLRSMGLNAPDARLIEKTSSEGAALYNAGKKSSLDAIEHSHYIVMERVFGSNYGNLTSSDKDIAMVYSNLESLGELAVYDLVLCNFDRFQLDSMAFNAGNIMFEDGNLRPIDTDCQADTYFAKEFDRFRLAQLILKKIAENRGGYETKIAQKLITNLGDGAAKSEFPTQKILIGMEKAMFNLMTATYDSENFKQNFVQSCRERVVPLHSFPKKKKLTFNML